MMQSRILSNPAFLCLPSYLSRCQSFHLSFHLLMKYLRGVASFLCLSLSYLSNMSVCASVISPLAAYISLPLHHSSFFAQPPVFSADSPLCPPIERPKGACSFEGFHPLSNIRVSPHEISFPCNIVSCFLLLRTDSEIVFEFQLASSSLPSHFSSPAVMYFTDIANPAIYSSVKHRKRRYSDVSEVILNAYSIPMMQVL